MKNMIQVVTDILLDIGIKPNLKGFKCLRRALLITIESEKNLKLTSDIYMQVGKEYGDSHSRVERAIRHSIETALAESQSSFAKYVPTVKNGKTTNGEVIAALTDYIKLHKDDLTQTEEPKSAPGTDNVKMDGTILGSLHTVVLNDGRVGVLVEKEYIICNDGTYLRLENYDSRTLKHLYYDKLSIKRGYVYNEGVDRLMATFMGC